VLTYRTLMAVGIALIVAIAFVALRARRTPKQSDRVPQLSDREATRLLGRPIGGIENATKVTRGDNAQIQRLRQELRVKVLHDEAAVNRLVAAERERAPSASEVDCYRAAIARWERDNR